MAPSELETLAPTPVVVEGLTPGSPAIQLLDLKTRQLFRLLKILTRGAGPRVLELMDFNLPERDFVVRLVALLVMSIPEAEQETLEFLASMVEPANQVKKPKLNRQEQEHNAKVWADMNNWLVNPEIDDTITIIEALAEHEAPHLQALGKRVAGMVEMFTKTGQDQEAPAVAPSNEEMAVTPPPEPMPAPSAPASPVTPWAEPSQPPLTSSPVSTAGPTDAFTNYPYDASSRSQTPSPGDASESGGMS